MTKDEALENRFNSELAVGTVPRIHSHQWQGLTHDEIDNILTSFPATFKFARAIEAKLKEKNT